MSARLTMPVQARVNGRPWWDNGYMLVPHRPPAPHEQRLTVLQPMRRATCEEALCTWYALGQEGMDEGRPFRHPVGARCGDFGACLPCTDPELVATALGMHRKRPCGRCAPCRTGTANCPCAGRRHMLPNTEEYESRVLDEAARQSYRPQSLRHRRTVAQGGQAVSREVGAAEWKDSIQAGLDARRHIQTRGI